MKKEILILVFVLVIVSSINVQGYALQCVYTAHESWHWLGVQGRNMETVGNNCDFGAANWGYLEQSVNGAYGGIMSPYVSPSIANQNQTFSSYGKIYGDTWTAPYSNGTLQSVMYMYDYFGLEAKIIPWKQLPTAPGQQVWLMVTSQNYDTGDDWTQWRFRNQGAKLGGSQPTDYVMRYSTGPNMNWGTSYNRKNPMVFFAIAWDACDFTCDTYTACQLNDTIQCSNIIGGNGTGYCPVTTYNGDGSDWISACDYCTPRWDCTTYDPVECGELDTVQNCTAVQDLDNCYAQTGLASDQYTGDYSEFQRTCYQGGAPAAPPPKEDLVEPPLPPEEEPKVVTCNPGVQYVEREQTKLITSFRNVEIPYNVEETVAETTCGIDADGDGNLCDLNEDFISCNSDCSIKVTEILCVDQYRCMLTEAWFLQIILLIELLVSTYLLYMVFLG